MNGEVTKEQFAAMDEAARSAAIEAELADWPDVLKSRVPAKGEADADRRFAVVLICRSAALGLAAQEKENAARRGALSLDQRLGPDAVIGAKDSPERERTRRMLGRIR